MSAKRHVVTLTAAERAHLHGIGRKGRAAAYRRRRAQIYLQGDQGPAGPGRTDAATAEMLSLSPRTVAYARRALAHEGRAAALPPPPLDHPRRARTLDGAGEAQLVRLACAPAPAGHSQWTLQLLADRLVELEVVDGISAETVRVTLQKTRCSLGRSAAGACPPRTTAISSAPWSRSWTPTNARWTLPARWCA